ncbi:DUF4149 domain-containing protein [Chamaesiphon sp. OTE_75_metabat_556]|jgi:Domain of unknown function (DUF4149)|uniref:DUF4149 domain-containing protein n=1 Tax=Chamaesiphon sp. OTE_75_metabat_556 TaxID=2964692 RepID=UPI00286AD27B|nr:DUF4149 domain-containing protein [Chamaesiphon sp. OTE_75_metabat_556]
MTQAFNGGDKNSFLVGQAPTRRWQNVAMGSLGLWIGGSLVLDLVVMPTLWATGMMESSGFASASYSIFWIFNRVELLCAAAALSSVWALIEVSKTTLDTKREMLASAVMLLFIALSYTFVLTPYMSGLGIDLDVFTTTTALPADMDRLHAIYWILEASKLGIAGLLLSKCNGVIAR